MSYTSGLLSLSCWWQNAPRSFGPSNAMVGFLIDLGSLSNKELTTYLQLFYVLCQPVTYPSQDKF
jgi:hypothetical protein